MFEPPTRFTNRRRGTSPKMGPTGTSKVRLDISGDRAAPFAPQLIARYQRRCPEFDDEIVSMYARGMSARPIRDHLAALHGIDVPPESSRPSPTPSSRRWPPGGRSSSSSANPLLFLGAIRLKVYDERYLGTKAVHIALGIQPEGTREVLGLSIWQIEGAKC